ncbi:CotH kinase family protein [Arthrospiribacter ruber]|nr:CotH kinase family protein [Arthrospiribacter ruber]
MVRAQVVINEIMSSNSMTISDEDGDFEDWIELYNTGDQEVNLLGYGLSDNENNPFKWIFPNVNIAGKGFLLIWASGKDRTDINKPLHTNYAISSAGEEIVLTHPQNFVVDEFPPIPIPTNYSYGRQPDGSENLVFFESPTPNSSNVHEGFTEFLKKPSILFKETDENTLLLEIHNPNESGKLLYTLDGSEPSMESLDIGRTFKVDYYFPGESETNMLKDFSQITKSYVAPLNINLLLDSIGIVSDIITTYHREFDMFWQKPSISLKDGIIVRARVFSEGRYSPTSSKTYLPGKVLNNHHLPVLSLIADNEDLFGYDEGLYVPGRMFFENGGTPDHFVIQANYQQRGRISEKAVNLELFKDKNLVFSQGLGMRIHGSGSRNRPIKGFRLYARNEYDEKDIIDYPFIPDARDANGQELNTFKRLLFRQGGDRLDYLTDAVIHQILAPLQLGLQRSEPMVHYINGEYWGLINVRDRIDRYYVADNYQIDPDDVVLIDSPWGEGSPAMVDEGAPESIGYYREMRDLILNTDMTEPEALELIEGKLDIISYIDHVVAFVYWNNVDWYGDKHFRIWKSTQEGNGFNDGKFRYIVWDFDAALTNGAGFNTLINWIDPYGGNEYGTNDPEKTRIFRKLLENDSFKTLFLNRFNDHINTAFNKDRVADLAEKHYNKIEPEFDRHFERWNFYPSSITSLYHYKNHLTRFREYAEDRPAIQREHLREAFGLDKNLTIKINVRERGSGTVFLNTIHLDSDLPGSKDHVYPWEGTYFKHIPVTLKAIPSEGYAFDYWIINGQQYREENLIIDPTADLEILVNFSKDNRPEPELIYYWFFDDNIPNNIPLKNLAPVFNTTENQIANIKFQPAIDPYPLNEGNTVGIMDRVNDPTTINFIEYPKEDISFDLENMRGIRTRNPLSLQDGGTEKKGHLIFSLPTTNFKDLVFRAAVSRTNNGPNQLKFEYSTAEELEWRKLPEGYQYFDLNTSFQLLELDLTELDEINGKENFKLRIGFEGNTTNTSGNVRFNNVSFLGVRSDPERVRENLPEGEKIILLTFPNPAKNELKILLNSNRIGDLVGLQVVSLQGSTLLNHSAGFEDYLRIDTSTWPPGTYILRAISTKNTEVHRIIKN